ncbi:unnamed protein product [Spirodela intermedia]|uniref:Uncharacterized protein n=1 Tax=Spirodela intermedia TaxID=51605 RepID=A0A7I8J0E1_SPIIN|nr:unnamed protein product [Spirodela intermedia]CAA6663694.1 unnamed protein product [Spirodela intermedia]
MAVKDQRLPAHRVPVEYVPLSQLAEIGILYWHLDPKTMKNNGADLLELCPGKVENYEEKLNNFFREHIHADEEIRFCLEGSVTLMFGKDDHWIRIWIKAGDMIVLQPDLPSLHFRHLKLLDEAVHWEPVWTAYNRPQEDHPARRVYIKSFLEKPRIALKAV